MGKIFKHKTDIQYKKSFQKNKVSLGMGGFAEVKLVYHKDDPKTLYAMKKVKKRNQQKIENIHKEISLHSQLCHENIIKFIDQLETSSSYLFFLEYAENGDLYNYVKKKELTLKEIVDYFSQICKAVQYLHSRNIMHRDLKLENILLTKDNKIKICDFGWSVVFENGQNRETLCGTYEYMAYEIFLGQPQTVKTDIWALGVILYELFHRRPPFRAQNLAGIIQKIQNPEQHLSIDAEVPFQAQQLIKQILQQNPQKRPSIKEILSHQFFEIDTNTCYNDSNLNQQNFKKKIQVQKLNVPEVKYAKDFTSSQDTLFDKHSTVGTLNEKKISFKKLLNLNNEKDQNQSRKSPTQQFFQELYQTLKNDDSPQKNSDKKSNLQSQKSSQNSKKLKKQKSKFEDQIENRNKSKTYTFKTSQRIFFDQNQQRNYSQNKRLTVKERSQVSTKDQIKPQKHSVKVQKFSLLNERQSYTNCSTERNKNILQFNIPDLNIKKLLSTPKSDLKRKNQRESQKKTSLTENKKFVNSIYMQLQQKKQIMQTPIKEFKSEVNQKSNSKQKSHSKNKIKIKLSQQNSNQSLDNIVDNLTKLNQHSYSNILKKDLTYKRYQSFQSGIQLSYREHISSRKVKANLNNDFLNIYSKNRK